MIPSMCCKFGQTGSITTCARERGRVWERVECADSSVVVGFELKRPEVPAGSGEEFRRPSGFSGSGKGGELERRRRGFK
jgi:hypothetical protein